MEPEKQAELIPLLMGCLENRPPNHQEGWAVLQFLSFFLHFYYLQKKNLVTDNNLIEIFCESKHMLESAEVSFASLADTEMGQNHK